MERHRLRLPFAVVTTVVAAVAATVALRPRTGLIEPAAVEPKAYFSPSQIERAEDFRGPQRALGVAGLAVSGGVLAVIALRPPRAVRRALARAEARPLAGGAAVGAGLSLGLVLVTLPIDAVAHARAVDVDLSAQSFGPWLVDVGKSAAVGAVLAGGGAAIALLVVRRFPRRPWLPGTAAVIALSAAFVFLSPLVLEPIFNRFTPLPRGQLRAEVLELAERAGVEVGEVFRVDASRRTTGANAYVGGLGHTKWVVLYDTLLDRFSPSRSAPSSPTSSRTSATATWCTGSCGSQSSPRRRCSSSRSWPSGSRGRRAVPTAEPSAPGDVRRRGWVGRPSAPPPPCPRSRSPSRSSPSAPAWRAIRSRASSRHAPTRSPCASPASPPPSSSSSASSR